MNPFFSFNATSQNATQAATSQNATQTATQVATQAVTSWNVLGEGSFGSV